jgi:hypothetical protein
MDTIFNEVDQLQCLPTDKPIPEDITIPNNSADVQAYLKRIALPRNAEDDYIGNINAKFILL